MTVQLGNPNLHKEQSRSMERHYVIYLRGLNMIITEELTEVLEFFG